MTTKTPFPVYAWDKATQHPKLAVPGQEHCETVLVYPLRDVPDFLRVRDRFAQITALNPKTLGVILFPMGSETSMKAVCTGQDRRNSDCHLSVEISSCSSMVDGMEAVLKARTANAAPL